MKSNKKQYESIRYNVSVSQIQNYNYILTTEFLKRK